MKAQAATQIKIIAGVIVVCGSCDISTPLSDESMGSYVMDGNQKGLGVGQSGVAVR
jgi:hypothetical protein